MGIKKIKDIENYLNSGYDLRSKNGTVVRYFKSDYYLVRQKNSRFKLLKEEFFKLYQDEDWEILEDEHVKIDEEIDKQYYEVFKHK